MLPILYQIKFDFLDHEKDQGFKKFKVLLHERTKNCYGYWKYWITFVIICLTRQAIQNHMIEEDLRRHQISLKG